MAVIMKDKTNFGVKLYAKAGKGGLFNPDGTPDTNSTRLVKIKPLATRPPSSDSDEVELKG